MFRNAAVLCALALAAGLPVSADFSYTTTQKSSGGSTAAISSKIYFKGLKSAVVRGDRVTITDFAARTTTTVNTAQKTYKVQKWTEMSWALPNTDVTMDVKETGQTRMIGGFNAKQTILTMNTDFETGRGPAMKVQTEIEVWLSAEVPGWAEMRAFRQKNADNFSYPAMTGEGAQSFQKAHAQVEKKLAESEGMVVRQVVRIKMAMPQMTPMETTADNTGFSAAAIPDSQFVVPSDYKQVP